MYVEIVYRPKPIQMKRKAAKSYLSINNLDWI